MPVDNVQKFESLENEAMILQEMADRGEDVDTINSLSQDLRSFELKDTQISIVGGLVEVKALSLDQDIISAFVPNEDGISGTYDGLSWRSELISYPDDTTQAVWRICHVIAGDVASYIDGEGDKIVRTPLSYVTVEGSNIDLISPFGSHDYRRLSEDGVALLIDQIGIDDNLDLAEKAERIAKFFRIHNSSMVSESKIAVYRQLVSYLNEYGIFKDTVVFSPYGITRNREGELIVGGVDTNIFGVVDHVALDYAIDSNGAEVANEAALSYEVMIEGVGHVSIPHIPTVTKLYELV